MVLKCFQNTSRRYENRLSFSPALPSLVPSPPLAPSIDDVAGFLNDMGGFSRIKMQIRINKPGRRFPASVDLPSYNLAPPAGRDFLRGRRTPPRVCWDTLLGLFASV